MSNFNYYLNRQGSRGRQGIKGDKGENGYSPYIDIKSNTPTEFIMTIHNETESFDTPNLIPTAIGEKVTEMDAVLTTHTEDIANLKLEDQNINTNITSLQGDLTNLSEEVNTLSGEVASNSADITAIKNKNNTQDSDIAKLKTRVGGTEESIEDLNHKYTVLGSEVSDLSVKKQNRLVEGNNITLTDNADGTTTISASGGGGGGGEGGSPLDSFIEGSTNDNTTTISVKGGKALKLDAPTIAVGDNLVNNMDADTMQLYLKQGDITAGDNVTVDKTATGIRISSTGGTGDIPIATTEVAGKVKPDGTTITVTEDGTISAIGGGSIPDNVALKDTTNTFTEPQRFEGSSSAIRIASNASDSAYGQINRPDGNSVNIQACYGYPAALLISTSGLIYTDSNGVGHDLLAASTPTNMVTIDTNQTVSGVKTFTNGVNIGISGFESIITPSDNSDSGQRQDLSITSSGNLTLNTGNIVTTDDDGGTHIKKGSIKDGDGNIVLTQGNVTAGNNITITKTNKGIQIASSGGGSSEPPANMVTTDTTQTIKGSKTFLSNYGDNEVGILFGNYYINGNDDVQDGYIGNYRGQVKFSTGNPAIEDDDVAVNLTRGTRPTVDLFSNGDEFPILRIGKSDYLSEIKHIIPDALVLTSSNTNSGYGYGQLTIGSTTLEYKKDDGTVVDLLNNSSKEQYGIRADYALIHGIVSNPNGIISYNVTDKVITVRQGLILGCAGSNDTAKTIISGDIQHTVTSTGSFTLFYANGELLECGKVDYSTEEPTDNGVANYQAWFNPDKTANTNQQWQFKSNDSGNVWRYVDNATPLADIVATSTAITSISYLGYRVFDDDVFAHKSEWVYKAQTLVDNVAVVPEDVSIDLSEYLPNDGYDYEVMLSFVASPPSGTLNKFSYISLMNNKTSSRVNITQTRTVVKGLDNRAMGNCIFPINNNSKLIMLTGSTSTNFDGARTVYAHAYRRINY